MGGMKISFPANASPRDRIIIAAKHLMSAVGYENTTTEAICREANTSEAQLTKYFGTKEALLQAIFEEGWARLRMKIPMLQTVQSPRNQIKMLIHLVIQGFSDDRPWRDLMLLEGRRIRGKGKMVMLTAGYRELVALLDSLISAELKGKASRHQVQLVRSSIIGVFEGLLRDLVLHERFEFPAEFSAEQVEHYIADVVDRLLRPAQR
jgi:AcrR family transcriptional regulator